VRISCAQEEYDEPETSYQLVCNPDEFFFLTSFFFLRHQLIEIDFASIENDIENDIENRK